MMGPISISAKRPIFDEISAADIGADIPVSGTVSAFILKADIRYIMRRPKQLPIPVYRHRYRPPIFHQISLADIDIGPITVLNM